MGIFVNRVLMIRVKKPLEPDDVFLLSLMWKSVYYVCTDDMLKMFLQKKGFLKSVK